MSEESCIIEEFLRGEAVRVVIIGDQAWQIKLAGEGWLKSIHPADADFMDLDPDLRADTETIRAAFGLEIIANDYIVGEDGSKHLLEVNHIPNVTRFPRIWETYRDYVVNWINEDA
jgi:glutathione synthase/RimK-type ligase-like ATP-grasp enzyme